MPEHEFKEREFFLKKLNTWIAAIGAVGVIASIFFGFSSQTAAIKNQWSHKFYDEKLSIYVRATEAAAKIASLRSIPASDAEIQKAILEFRTLFWGPMCITEGTDVESAMVLYEQALRADLPAKSLEQLSLRLAHICRNEAHVLFPDEANASSLGDNESLLKAMTARIPKDSQNPKSATE